MKRVVIAPSIIAADQMRLGEEVRKIEEGGAGWIHVDVMDGHFVPNITIGLGVVKDLRRVAQIPIDSHLMITNPDLYAALFCDAGSDYVSIHIETKCDHWKILADIRKRGKRCGIAVNPPTSAEEVVKFIPHVDYLVVMSVNPGFYGQSFIRDVLGKIEFLRKKIDEMNPECLLQVDGGIDQKNAAGVISRGADILVAGAAVFKKPDYGDAIAGLKQHHNGGF